MGSKPTSRVSMRRATPVCASTRSRTCCISGEDVGCGPLLVDLDEVGVLGRDRRRSVAMTLVPDRLDQPAGRVVRRVDEYRARVVTAGLVLTAPSHDLGDLGLGLDGITRRQQQLRAHDHLVGRRSTTTGTPGRGRRRPGGTARHPEGPRPRRRPGWRPCRTRAHRRSCAPHHRSSRGRRPPIRIRSGRPRRCGGRRRGGWPHRRRRTVGPSISTAANPSPSRTTTPANPSSWTSRLEPRPTTSTGTSVPTRTSATNSRSSGPSARTSAAAGPPTR